jgi:hypothetical protein
MGEVIDGAVQQAPQPLRQGKDVSTMARSVVRLGKHGAAG